MPPRVVRTLGLSLVVAGLVVAGTFGPVAVRAARDGNVSWGAAHAIPSAATYSDPALASVGGYLYAAWVGQTSPYQIWYSRFNGSTWSAAATIPSALTTQYTAPALTNYQGELYAAWTGETSPYTLWFAEFNGSTWTAQTKVPSAITERTTARQSHLSAVRCTSRGSGLPEARSGTSR
ncbi:MAG: hypothetical protein WB805_10055 [Candidatus Dormiibacterota bacterium]